MEQIYEIAQEQLREISLDLPASQRMHYVDSVMEAMNVKGNEAAMLYTLYKEIQKINDVDFGKIPDSRGNITKYQYYSYLQKSVEALTGLNGADNIEVIQLADRTHTTLLNYRRDFEFGYDKAIDMITMVYETLTVSLYALIDMSISEYTKYMKLDFQAKNLGKFNAKESIVIAQTCSMLKTFENGNWGMLMRSFRNQSAKETQEALAPGNEAVSIKGVVDTIKNSKIYNAEFEFKNGDKSPNAPKNIDVSAFKVGEWVKGAWNNAGVAMKVIFTMIAILLSVRLILTTIGKISGFLSGCARNQAALLRAAMDAKRANGESVSELQVKLVEKLEGLADVIDRKYDKAEKVARKEIAQSNKENFGSTEVIAGSIPQGVDFGF